MGVSVALARRIDDTSGAHCKYRECKLSAVNAWGFFEMRHRACDIPMSLPSPGRFLPRLGPPAKAARSFPLRTYLDCGCVERQDAGPPTVSPRRRSIHAIRSGGPP